MDEEAGKLRNMDMEKNTSALLLLRLAFQSLGVVYGDLGTSPLYVFYNTFPDKIEDPEDDVGALPLIIYSRTLIALIKYVFIVCNVNDNGQGGTRSTFHEKSFAAETKRWLEKDVYKKHVLLVLDLIGRIEMTSAIFGISFSIWGNQSRASKHKQWYLPSLPSVVSGVAVVILVGLCSMQHYGTDRVSWLFAPIVLLWFLVIGGIGTYNICAYDSSVLKAFSPVYICRYFKRRRKDGWISLGSIMLILDKLPTSVRTGTMSVMRFITLYQHIWPVFAIAIAAAIVAIQATISAIFSIIKQALAHGCFPRVKVVHTLKKFHGQVYIPDMNWLLTVLCIAGFKNQSQIANAYGTAVVFVMFVTTLLMTLIMILVWRSLWIFVFLFTSLPLVVECTFMSAVLFKIDLGGWIPLVIAGVFLVVMNVWHYGRMKRYELEMHGKVSMAWLLGLVRVPEMGMVYTELSSGVPHIFYHFITNLPAIHSVVFVCVKYLPVYTVPEEERFLVKRIGPNNFHLFRCVARYGYRDLHRKDDDFEKKLFDSLFSFVRLKSMTEGCLESDECSWHERQTEVTGTVCPMARTTTW
ncbi:putative potassium transporter 11 [Hibiscus syriacus]|uniref:Potassium transporter 11 n=1 Tax=Hibiscus syriacus TaxID=106335 RepID=A0A6A2X1R0_HIBSY|nr:putative potassium transporter 11 [Hibiscus syriacus]